MRQNGPTHHEKIDRRIVIGSLPPLWKGKARAAKRYVFARRIDYERDFRFFFTGTLLPSTLISSRMNLANGTMSRSVDAASSASRYSFPRVVRTIVQLRSNAVNVFTNARLRKSLRWKGS